MQANYFAVFRKVDYAAFCIHRDYPPSNLLVIIDFCENLHMVYKNHPKNYFVNNDLKIFRLSLQMGWIRCRKIIGGKDIHHKNLVVKLILLIKTYFLRCSILKEMTGLWNI